MFKSLFDKCVKLASSKFADYSLAIISFIESSFFPVPPDIMIVPMVVAKKEKYLKIFLIATLFSSLGALLGYFIGSFFFNEFGVKVFEFYGYNNTDFLKEKFKTSDGSFSWLLILFTAAFTPIPFKLVTIFSGFIEFNLILFFFLGHDHRNNHDIWWNGKKRAFNKRYYSQAIISKFARC